MSSRPTAGASHTDQSRTDRSSTDRLPTERGSAPTEQSTMAPARAVVVVGGPPPRDLPVGVRSAVSEGDPLVVAVDSGLHLAVELRERSWVERIDLVIGDLDSVDLDLLGAVEQDGTEVQRHPVDKDATDLELALDHVLALGVSDTVVVAGSAGRLDHLLVSALVLGADRYAALGIEAWFGPTRVIPLHDRVAVDGEPGATISLVPTHGTATGVRTTGLRWELCAEDLHAGSGRGISNEFLAEHAELSVERGPLTIVIPQEAP